MINDSIEQLFRTFNMNEGRSPENEVEAVGPYLFAERPVESVLFEEPEIDPAFSRGVRLASQITGSGSAVIFARRRGSFLLRARYSPSGRFPLCLSTVVYPALPGILEKGEPLFLKDVDDLSPAPLTLPFTGSSPTRCAAIPIIGQNGHRFAVLCVFAERPEPWSDEEQFGMSELAQAVAEQVDLRADRRSLAISWSNIARAPGVASWEMDPETKQIRYISEAILDFSGFPASDWAGTDLLWDRLVSDDHRAALLDAISSPRHDAPPQRVPIRWVDAQGTVQEIVAIVMHEMTTNGQIRILGSFSPARQEDPGNSTTGEMAQHVAEIRRVAQHVTARAQFLADASERLTASFDYEESLRELASLAVSDFTDICVVEMAEDDDTTRRLITATRHPEQANLMQRLDEQMVAHETNVLKTVIRTGMTQMVEEIDDSMLRDNNQSEHHIAILEVLNPVSLIVVPLTIRGSVLGAIGFLSTTRGKNFTNADRVLAEDLARRAALTIDNARLYTEAQRAIELRNDFLSMAAHELKTPVTSLRGFAQLTMRQILKRAPVAVDQLQRRLQMIDQQSDRLSQLVAQLLDISRIEADRLTLDYRTTDLVALVRETIDMCEANTEHHTITLNAPDTLIIDIDPLRIEQVFTNLIDNAMKYSPPDTNVTVELTTDPEQTQISVTDTGMGIPEDALAQVFNRFYRADHTSHLGGLGLGLYISREIVERHHGTLDASQPDDGGTRFTVTLPTNPLSTSEQQQNEDNE